MSSLRPDLLRRVVAEGVGTALLLTAVVGSGIMGDRLSGGSEGLALLANSLATGAALVAIILTFGPVSGAHINPAVTVARCGLSRETAAYALAQVGGALVGVAVAHLMFGEPAYAMSTHARAGASQLLGELVATFGLLSAVSACERQGTLAAPFVIGAYITGAYWFTSSTSFANPAVSVARAFTDTFTGIRPVDVPGFIAMQFLGAFSAVAFDRWLHGERS
jgi:glycerol uptake facilitator-like aquaporin